MSGRPKIVLLGMLTKMPVGGVAWLMAQYIVGFERLGFEVYYVEAHARTPSMFITHEGEDGTDRAADYLGGVMARFGLQGRWALHALHADGRCVGMTPSQLNRLYANAALIINMHGGTVPLPEHAATGRLVLLNTDPVELELEIADGCQRALDFLEPHAALFTWGLNHGNPDCLLPWATDHAFVPSPPPVVLDMWPTDAPPPEAPLTTIGNWRQDWREINFQGEKYGWSKHHEFLKIVDLPRRVSGSLELALSSAHDEDREMLREHGWLVRDGLTVSADMDDYREYIGGSSGEFTVAKDQNVRFRSGWFSERSTCYLAAGRPVIMQDTGFGNALPTGWGLLSFTDVDSAAAAVEAVLADGAGHRRAARDIALEHLSYDIVLPAMLQHIGLSTGIARPVRPAPRPLLGPLDFDADLELTPLSRRPLVLSPAAERAVLARPVPSTSADTALPRASVLMPVLDNLTVTRLAVESVLANTSVSYELILVDNGSLPPTQQYLSAVAARNSHVRLIRNTVNRGFAAAVNQGLLAASADLFVILNNDVITPRGWLEGLCERLRDPSVGIVGPVTNRCGNEAQIETAYERYGELAAFVDERRQSPVLDPDFDIPVATMFCAALRRETLQVVGLLDERFGPGLFEDDDYCRRVRAAGLRVVCSPKVFVHHFGEASLGQLAAQGSYGSLFEENRRRFEDKWGDTWQRHERAANASYSALVQRVQEAMSGCAPSDGVSLVISKGDEQLVPPGNDRLRHFPCLPSGVYSGHHPADDAEAIELLEQWHAAGATSLVIPATSMWWLAHYGGLARHLNTNYPEIYHQPETAVIYSLNPANEPENTDVSPPADVEHDDLVQSLLAERESLRRQLREMEQAQLPRLLKEMTSRLDHMEDLLDDVVHVDSAIAEPSDGADAREWRDLIRRHVPRGAHVLVGIEAGSDVFSVPGRQISPFIVDDSARASLIARLEAWRADGAQYLLLTPTLADTLDRVPRFADHLIGHYAAVPTASPALIFDVRERAAAVGGSSRALSAVAERISRSVDEDVAVLDWTESVRIDRVGALNVFEVPAGTTLPHMDRSISIVIIDNPSRAAEAARVASAAVISVDLDLRPVSVHVDTIDPDVHRRLITKPALGLVTMGQAHDQAWEGVLNESLSDHEVMSVDDVLRLDDGLVVVTNEQVLPLPGCVAAARETLRSGSVGAVAVKVLDADGSLAAAGVTVFSDGSSAGIGAGTNDVGAAWHEFVRDVCAGGGLLFLSAGTFAAISSQTAVMPTDPIAWSAAVWALGQHVVYQPECEVVRAQPAPQPRFGTADPGWARLAAHRPDRGDLPLDDAFWRRVLATDDVSSTCLAMVEVRS